MNIRYNPSIINFGMPMGLIGAGVNAQHLTSMLSLHNDIASWILFYGWLSLAVVSIHYLLKIMGSTREGLLKEWLDPAELSFFPAVTLTFLLFILSMIPVFDFFKLEQHWLERFYFALVAVHAFLNIKIITRWLFQEHIQISHHQPSWYILLSGNFMVVIAGLEFIDIKAYPFWKEVLWLFFSTGLFLWLTFTTSLFYKLLFAEPLSKQARPSLFIFLAPPSLATISSLLLMDVTEGQYLIAESIHLISWILFSFASLMMLLWISSIRFFYQGGLSMLAWAYIYPLAAYGLACQYLAEKLGGGFFIILSIVILIVVMILIALLTVWILKQAFQKKLD